MKRCYLTGNPESFNQFDQGTMLLLFGRTKIKKKKKKISLCNECFGSPKCTKCLCFFTFTHFKKLGVLATTKSAALAIKRSLEFKRLYHSIVDFTLTGF